jgi:Xaa-Pro aminopeptidase
MKLWVALLTLVACPSVALAQPVFAGHEIFPPAEFAARRARIIERIGPGVAIIQGTTERPGEQPFRQNNQFFYLCGVAEPRAILVIDGRTQTSTVFMQPRNERREQRMLGPGLYLAPRPRRRRASTG